MLLELPTKFKRSYAKVESGNLMLYNINMFETLMYKMSYSKRGLNCVYCEEPLTRETATIDHRYPVCMGGPSIVNNLFPCCPRCNCQKSLLTHQQYLRYKKKSEEGQKKYLQQINKYNDAIYRKKGYNLPKKWVSIENIDNIYFLEDKTSLAIKDRRYYKLKEKRCIYGNLTSLAILDKNNFLLAGYFVLKLAIDLGITEIPVIKLENVEYVNN